MTKVVLLPDITYFYYCRYGSLSNFRKRDHIDKEEILKTIGAMAEVRRNSESFKHKPYFHKRMYKVMMTHFYMACAILKEEKNTVPPFLKSEIRDIMHSPLTFMETMMLKGWKLRNMSLYLLGILPPMISVALI